MNIQCHIFVYLKSKVLLVVLLSCLAQLTKVNHDAFLHILLLCEVRYLNFNNEIRIVVGENY